MRKHARDGGAFFLAAILSGGKNILSTKKYSVYRLTLKSRLKKLASRLKKLAKGLFLGRNYLNYLNGGKAGGRLTPPPPCPNR